MNIAIQGWKQDSTLDVPAHVESRMYYALGRFVGRIHRVSVRLRDLNGPKGGQDKSCQIQMLLRNGAQLVVEKRASGWLDAVDAAASSVGRAVVRAVSRTDIDRRRTIRGM